MAVALGTLSVKDGGGTSRSVRVYDEAGDGSGPFSFTNFSSSLVSNPSATFTRPADTTAYASGDLVANSTTAGSVTPMSFTAARVATGSFFVRAARVQKSSTSLTNASFRLHLYTSDPSASTGIANGDNGAWSTKIAGYVGSIDVTMDRAFTDASSGGGIPAQGADLNLALASGTTLYGLLEARAAYTPTSGETFTVTLQLVQN